jgi:hypothetical protein
MRLSVLVIPALLLPGTVKAQTDSSRSAPPQMHVELLATAETERIQCARRRLVDAQAVQRGPRYGNIPVWDDAYPITWVVELIGSGRHVTLAMTPPRRPRQVLAVGRRAADLGGGMESVRVLFLADGSVQSGQRSHDPPRGSPTAAPERTGLDDGDGLLAHTLARELAFRCERGLTEPLVVGWIWSQIPPT